MLYHKPTGLHLITSVHGSSLTSNYILKFSVDTNFLFCLLNLLSKIIVQFQNLAASSVQKLIRFFFLSKDQEIFISQKKEKKGTRNIIL